MTPPYPHRLRLYSGRNVHAARPMRAARPTYGAPGLVTACGYMAGPGDERLNDATPVTCPACDRALRRNTPASAREELPAPRPVCGNDPRAVLTDGDQQAVDEARAYLAQRKDGEPQ